MSSDVSARLAAVGIQLLAEAKEYRLFGRENCAAFMHGDNAGSSGLMTEHGLAFLVWRGESPFLSAKGMEMPASAEQVETLRQFSEDLKRALEPRP